MEGEVPSDDDFADAAAMNVTNSNVIEGSHSASNVFCCAALGDTTAGIFYTDMTGSFQVTSLESMQGYFVAYDYDTNTIFAKPCPDFKDATIIAAFKEVFNEFKAKGYKPKFT